MACCVIAAFLIAQLVAMVRRWGIFWGVVSPQAHEDNGNVLGWLRARFASRGARRGLAVALMLEMGIAATWVYTAHGAHLYRLADEGVARLQGRRVVYIGLCTPNGGDHYVRLAFDPPAPPRG